MSKKSIEARAQIRPAGRVYRGITPKRAAQLLMVEATTIAQWMQSDPDTPIRAETAARLRELADILDLPK